MGHPGKFRRALTPEDQTSIEAYATRYVEYSETYKAEKPNTRHKLQGLNAPNSVRTFTKKLEAGLLGGHHVEVQLFRK